MSNPQIPTPTPSTSDDPRDVANARLAERFPGAYPEGFPWRSAEEAQAELDYADRACGNRR